MQWPRDGIQHRMMRPQPEITVAPDHFEVTAEDAVLVTQLRSAMSRIASSTAVSGPTEKMSRPLRSSR